MGKTIKQKIVTGIVAGGIGLSSLINGGCEMTPAQNMAVSGASTQHMAATSPNLSYQQRQSFGAMGGLLGVLSQQEAMKEAARQGKSEVNVNVSVPQKPVQQQETSSNPFETYLEQSGLKKAFFCEYYVDGEDWSTAFKEIKEVFRSDEKIRAVSLWENHYGYLNGKRVTLDVLAIDTNKIVYNAGELKVDPDNIIRGGVSKGSIWSTHYDLLANQLKQELGGNRFRIVWNLNQDPKEYADLTIIDVQKKELRFENYDPNQK